jgi:acetyl esterase/lipase
VLDPEIQPIVDLIEAAPAPPAHLVPIAQARAAHDRETAAMSGPGEEVAEVRDVEAPGPAGAIPIRMFRPLAARVDGAAPVGTAAPAGAAGDGGAPAGVAVSAGAAAPTGAARGGGALPLVAYLHGGGWVVGTIEAFDPLCRALANASGALIASIGYRLAPEHPFPAALEDARAAVRWLAANARELGADPDRMGIAGDSAGGNLATVIARRLRDDGGPPLRFQALIYPACDSGLNTPSYRDAATGFGLRPESMRRYWELYLGGADGRHPDASPLQAEDLAGLPPAYILTVRDDVLRDEGEAYARALEAAGVPVTLRRYDGAVHGFFRWLAKAELARRAVVETGAALRAGLAA